MNRNLLISCAEIKHDYTARICTTYIVDMCLTIISHSYYCVRLGLLFAQVIVYM